MLIDNEITQVRALSINIVRTIAERYGGVMDKSLIEDHIEVTVSVPEAQREICSQEITEQLSIVQNYFTTLLAGLLCGKLIVRINNN